MGNELNAVDGETLWDMELGTPQFCIKSLLPFGLCIMGGASKIGKSWLVLDWVDKVAKGEPVWGMETTQGTVLYLCLEDTLQRVQHRLYCIADEATPNAYYSTTVGTLADNLTEQIISFLLAHPDTVLIVIDTFQLVRDNGNDPSYAGDYQEIRKLKRIADEYRLTILLVHHVRKQRDLDPLKMLSGTTALSGAADAVYVLDRKNRNDSGAVLTCTGRDVEDREISMRFSKDRFVWEMVADSAVTPELLLPKELMLFLEYMREVKFFSGGNTELTDAFNTHAGSTMEPKKLKQLMNRWKEKLRELGLTFRSYRSNGQRLVEVQYTEPVTEVPQVTQKTAP